MARKSKKDNGRAVLSDSRMRMAKLTAISVLRSYSRDGALRRVREMGEGVRNLNPENKAFYERVEALVQEAKKSQTMDGEHVTWGR
ncbi:MAG: hypothetical protein GY769_04445 [bacterium]|nr:hypothetical protein [bacterium]